jgi:DNA-directed RNA polymerase subunit RPC12/RpoP
MSGHIRRDIERIEIMVVNQQMNKAVVEKFKDYCKLLGYPTNIVLETFMLQYADDRFSIPAEEIRKWEQEVHEIDVVGTTVSKDIYIKFRQACRDNGFYVKYVITAFMEKFSTRTVRMGYGVRNHLRLAPIMLSAERHLNAESAKIQSHKNDKLRCPYCGRYVEGVSDNWVLIQPYGDGKNYLACKDCGGHV